jgi:hypothetical protein
LFVLATLLIVTGIRENQKALMDQVRIDFTGSGNFFYWVLAVSLIGALGYIDSFRTVSRVAIGLIVLVFIISHEGFFAKLQEGIRGIQFPGSASRSVEGEANIATPQNAVPGGVGKEGPGGTGGLGVGIRKSAGPQPPLSDSMGLPLDLHPGLQ